MPVQVAGPDTAAGCPLPPSRGKRLQESNTRSSDR
jgi:hypothetical protein